MTDEFARRLQDVVEGVRAESARREGPRKAGSAAAEEFRRHLRRAVMSEAERMVRGAAGVLAGLGLRMKVTPEEVRVEAIPGARLPEAHPPWLGFRCREPGHPDARVVVTEASWRVDDPRTPLPESPCSIRHVSGDDTPAGIAELREFLAVAIEDFASCVTKYDTLPRP